MKKLTGAALLLICLLTGLLLSITACAAAPQPKTVRVGYLIYNGFQEGTGDNPKSGYGYEYLQELAYQANWKYEYVYGGFNELLTKLRAGEIDIMGNLSYTPERAQEISFPKREQGREQYYLYVPEDRADIKADDPSTLNGKRVGVNKGSYQAQLFEKWLRDNNVHCELIPYTNGNQRNSDTISGVIDANVSSILVADPKAKKQLRPLFQIGSSSYYIGVNKQRPDLLDDLNKAQNRLLQFDWYYNERVFLKYYGDNSVTLSTISIEDRQWFGQKGSFTVGYVDGLLPFTSWDSTKNSLLGILAVYQNHVDKRYHMHVDTKRFANYKEMRAALERDEIDSIYPFFCNYWTAESDGLMATPPLNTSYLVMLFKGDYNSSKTPSAIAAATDNSMQQFFIKAYYPNAKIIQADDLQDCVQAVLNGRATCTIISSDTYYANRNLVDGMESCNILNTGYSAPVGFAVKKGNLAALSFLKHSMTGLRPSDISKAMIDEGYAIPEPTLKQFINRNLVLSISIILALSMLIFGFLFYFLLTKRREHVMHQSNLELNKKIYIDFATGLPNKNKCEEIIASPEPLRKPTACAMFDLNDLKKINDSLGHEKGDLMIYSFAQLLRHAIPNKYFVGRFGGDEFILIAQGITNKQELTQLHEKIQQQITDFNKRIPDFQLSYSSGYAYSEDYEHITIQELLHLADEAMYANKKAFKQGR